MAYASEVELSGMGSVRSMRKQESHEFIRGSVKFGRVDPDDPLFAGGYERVCVLPID